MTNRTNFKKRSWEELKVLGVKPEHYLDYEQENGRYKILLVSGDTTFFTNIYNPDSHKPIGVDMSNDVDYVDFVDNYLQSIDDKPPKSIKDLPISELDGKKLAVHTSSKPIIEGCTTHAVWTGSGDDPVSGDICGGDMLEFNLTPGTPTHSIDAVFSPVENGRVWIHEGYLKFEDGGPGDYITAEIIASATPVQTVANLDLILGPDDSVKYSPSGPGTGTHGFADAQKVVLVHRSFSHDGDWDYDGVDLTPNFNNTGEYRIHTVSKTVHRYMNKIPCRGTCGTYFSMTSDDAAEIYQNYFMRITAYNTSDTTWTASVVMEIFRERTFNP